MVKTFTYTQEGSGTPSPENVRRIVPALNIDGIGNLYDGSFDTQTGKITEKMSATAVIRTSSFTMNSDGAAANRYFAMPLQDFYYSTSSLISNKFPTVEITSSNTDVGIQLTAINSRPHLLFRPPNVASIDSVKKCQNYVGSIGGFMILYRQYPTKTNTLTAAQYREAMKKLDLHGISAMEARRRGMMSQPHKATAQGAVASFRTDLQIPLKMQFELKPMQAGTGNPAPDNVRTITGHMGVDVIRTGKNIFDGVRISGYISDDGTEGIDGYNYHSNYIKVNAGDNYVYSMQSNYTSSVNRRIHAYDHNKNWLQMISKNASSGKGGKAFQFTVPNNASYIRVQMYSDGSGSKSDINIQIEKGTTATTYEAYTGTTKSITFPDPPETVYGCTMTINKDGTGVMVVTHGYLLADGSFDVASVTYSSSRQVYYVSVVNNLAGKNTGSSNPLYSNIFKNVGIAQIGNAYVTNGGRTLVAVIPDQTITTKQAATQWFADNNAQFVYPLATPVTYNLTSSQVGQILSQIGQNHVWIDNADSVSVEFWTH